MDSENLNDVGKTVLYRDLDNDKYELFITLLSFENSEFLDVLYKMVDKNTLLKILDIFA